MRGDDFAVSPLAAAVPRTRGLPYGHHTVHTHRGAARTDGADKARNHDQAEAAPTPRALRTWRAGVSCYRCSYATYSSNVSMPKSRGRSKSRSRRRVFISGPSSTLLPHAHRVCSFPTYSAPLPSLVPRHHSAPQYIPLGACAATRPPRSRVATYVTPSAPHPFTAHAGVRLPSWRGQLALYSCLEYVDKSSHGRLEHVGMGAWSMLKSRPIVALPQPWRRHIWASSRACVASSHMS